MDNWYELGYVHSNGETQTIFSSKDFEELEDLRENLIHICGMRGSRLFIDLWENPLNPKLIRNVR